MAESHETLWLIMFLDAQLSLALSKKTLDDGFSTDGVRYDDIGDSSLLAFYDRLLDSDDRFVGVRLWPMERRINDVKQLIGLRSYIFGDESRQFLDIFFGAPGPDVTSTNEQAFGGQLFRSFTGSLALSIDIGYLSKSGRDFMDLRTAAQGWRHID